MFPFPGPFKMVKIVPAKIDAPFEAEFTFVDGPFDGHKSTATVGCELSDRVLVYMKKTENEVTTKYTYRYAGDNKFKYEGIHEECPAPSLLETDPA